LFPSLILAKILAAHGWQIPAPKNWLANFGRVDVGAIQTSPKSLTQTCRQVWPPQLRNKVGVAVSTTVHKALGTSRPKQTVGTLRRRRRNC
jgi:hypothetical protein